MYRVGTADLTCASPTLLADGSVRRVLYALVTVGCGGKVAEFGDDLLCLLQVGGASVAAGEMLLESGLHVG
jgi:hypothetical protein